MKTPHNLEKRLMDGRQTRPFVEAVAHDLKTRKILENDSPRFCLALKLISSYSRCMGVVSSFVFRDKLALGSLFRSLTDLSDFLEIIKSAIKFHYVVPRDAYRARAYSHIR